MKTKIIFKTAIPAIIFVFLFIFSVQNVFAAVTVTAATGGSAISADTNTTNGIATWTALSGPTITETTGRAITPGSGTIILTAPSGFSFNTGATVTATITRDAGVGTCFTFSSNNVTPTASTITYTLTARDSNATTRCHVTFSNIQVRPIVGTPLASGNITNSGSNASVPSGSGNNYGTLTEVSGTKNKLVFTTQPSASATVDVDFATKPVIAVQDQYGNLKTNDNTTAVSRSAVLSTQICGGTAGSGVLTSTPASGSAVTAGVVTYTAMQYSFGESIKICATSAGITSALSNTITVSNPVPATTSIVPSSKTAGDLGFTLTINGSNFNSSSVVRFNGSNRATTFINSNQLAASILTSDLTVAGSFPITVFNPTPGGGTSNAQTFTVNTAPDTTPPTVTAFSIPATSSSLTVSITTFTATDNIAVTGYLVTESATTPSASDPSWSGTAPASFTFSGAGTKTAYAWAKDAAGNVSSSLSGVVTITLADTTPPVTVTDLIASNATNNSINLSWTAPGDDNNTGTATTYDIRYSTSVITSGNFDSATQTTGEPVPSIAGSAESFAVSGLSQSTTYYFAIKTSDEVPNTSAISNVASLATTATPDTTAPVVAVFDIPATSDSLTVPVTTFTATDNIGVAGFLLTETSVTPSAGASGWSVSSPANYIFSTQGIKILYAWAKDVAGNISTSLNDSVTITTTGSVPLSSSTDSASSGVRPTTINFSGKAFPDAKVIIIDKDVLLETPLKQDVVSGSDGKFYISFSGILQSQHLFGLAVKDKENRSSQTKFFNVDTVSNSLTEKDILVSPTIDFINLAVTRGKNAVIIGYATPGNMVKIEIDGKIKGETKAGEDGGYRFEINTGELEFGLHSGRVKQADKDDGKESDFSLTRSFIVSRLLSIVADFNGDGKIDIRDWSIFLSRWFSKNKEIQKVIDLNSDGKIDIFDFSIFIRNLRMK